MANTSKAKGTAAETAVARYLQHAGFPYAERRALAGTTDKGDITGTPGLVFEVKNHKSAQPAAWLDEAKRESSNAAADYGIVIFKRMLRSDPGDWFALLSVADLVRLLRQAGYGDSLDLDIEE